jgi:hypothetical protein
MRVRADVEKTVGVGGQVLTPSCPHANRAMHSGPSFLGLLTKRLTG